jgi:L,D-transpeptidase-like protein
MFGQHLGTRRRIALVASGVLACSSAAAVLASPAFAADTGAASLEGTPCTVTARACVELDTKQAWLVRNGKVIRGPVDISSGGDGEETPTGTFHVLSKDQNHVSKESKLPNGQGAPMPWSVFFAPGGIAFHSGSPERASAGCIHLEPADAQAWFGNLKVGDEVQVFQNDDDADGGGSGDDDSDHGDSDHGDSGDGDK